jgi:hypothetical protein
MRTFDPNRASVKHVFDTDRIETVKAAEETQAPPTNIGEEKSSSVPVEQSSAQGGLEIVAALKELTDTLLKQHETLFTIHREDSQKNIETIAAVTANIEKTQQVTVPVTTPLPPVSYVFEIERDAQGRIARVYANPVVATS